MKQFLPAMVAALVSTDGAQVFRGSGSNGSDGALSLGQATTVPSTIVFDPVALNLDRDGDNVFHFTSINIGPNATVRLRADKMRQNGPVVWLSTGAVTINGRLDLSGEAGLDFSTDPSTHRFSIPGPGGFPGGAGDITRRGWRGFGPGSAAPSNVDAPCPASHALPAGGGGFCPLVPAYGNSLIQPLIGGSGGSSQPFFGCMGPAAGGGAGGGAIRITSDVTITVVNGINADGGRGGRGFPNCSGIIYYQTGNGSGGAIHLQAPVLNVTNLTAAGVQVNGLPELSSSPGRIRLDYVSLSGSNFSPQPVRGPLVTVPLPVLPTVRITAIDGIAVPARPTGDYFLPDTTLNKSAPVTISVAATNIPPGTQLSLNILSDPIIDPLTSTGQIVTSTALTGTLASSTASASVTLPSGASRILVRATW